MTSQSLCDIFLDSEWIYTSTAMVWLQIDCDYSISQKDLALAIIGSIAELGNWDIKNAKLAGNGF